MSKGAGASAALVAGLPTDLQVYGPLVRGSLGNTSRRRSGAFSFLHTFSQFRDNPDQGAAALRQYHPRSPIPRQVRICVGIYSFLVITNPRWFNHTPPDFDSRTRNPRKRGRLSALRHRTTFVVRRAANLRDLLGLPHSARLCDYKHRYVRPELRSTRRQCLAWTFHLRRLCTPATMLRPTARQLIRLVLRRRSSIRGGRLHLRRLCSALTSPRLRLDPR